MTRTLLVSDIRIYLESLELALRDAEQVQVVGATSRFDEALQLTRTHRPDIVVLDIVMRDSLDLLRSLTSNCSARCVLLGVEENEEEVVACARAGAIAFVTRDASILDLVHCIKTTASGTSEIICSGRLAGRLFQRITEWLKGQPTSTISHLTPRELDILKKIEQGLSNKEIATDLTIQTATVKNHVHNILSKLGVERRRDAAEVLRRSGHYRADASLNGTGSLAPVAAVPLAPNGQHAHG